MTSPQPHDAPHIPVMLAEMLAALTPRDGGLYVDATFGAGGYTRAILAAASCNVFAIDRDPSAVAAGATFARESGGMLTLRQGRFSHMREMLVAEGIDTADGVVLDIGVSSMQIDQAERGFSFVKDGPLDMRMEQDGPSAADVVNAYPPEHLTRIIGVYGEEMKAKAVVRAIVRAREEAPILTTAALVKAIERALGPQRATDRIHPATRTFQALRIFVNAELEELAQALAAAEHILKPGGRLAIVTFHSLEDRIVKRFFAERSGAVPLGSRHAPAPAQRPAPSFELLHKGHLAASEQESRANPRARSAKLRAGIRTAAPAHRLDVAALGVPRISMAGVS